MSGHGIAADTISSRGELMRRSSERHHRERWGLILAGGEGLRLRSLTRVIAGDGRPKQFCSVLGPESLLEQTWRRAALEIPPARTAVVVTEAHERYYAPLVAGRPRHCVVVQPENRGTAAAILYGALRIAAMAPLGAVAVLPSDHYVSDDSVFMDHVAAAFAAVEARPDLMVLLGITPEGRRNGVRLDRAAGADPRPRQPPASRSILGKARAQARAGAVRSGLSLE